MVVVTARRKERGRIAEPRGKVEAEHVSVERNGALEIRHLHVDVADVDAWIDAHDGTVIAGAGASADARWGAGVSIEPQSHQRQYASHGTP